MRDGRETFVSFPRNVQSRHCVLPSLKMQIAAPHRHQQHGLAPGPPATADRAIGRTSFETSIPMSRNGVSADGSRVCHPCGVTRRNRNAMTALIVPVSFGSCLRRDSGGSPDPPPCSPTSVRSASPRGRLLPPLSTGNPAPRRLLTARASDSSGRRPAAGSRPRRNRCDDPVDCFRHPTQVPT